MGDKEGGETKKEIYTYDAPWVRFAIYLCAPHLSFTCLVYLLNCMV